MTDLKDINITESEWRIMRVVWTLKSVTSKELIDILGDAMNWKPATIKTLLRRLTDKNILSTEKIGNKFIYTSNVAEGDTIDLATKKFFAQVCSMKVGSAIADIIDESQLTQSDIDLITSKLNMKKPVDSIECNCIPNKISV